MAPPWMLHELMAATPGMGAEGEFLRRIFGVFDFGDITLTPPSVTFEGELTLHVGGKTVRLIEVGPAHTRGDTIVHVPSERLAYAADILFVGRHPVVWEGPVANWVRGLDLLLALEVDVIVPGHGPLAGKREVAELKGYFEYLQREVQERYEAGLSAMEAALDISFSDYAAWGEAERIVANVEALYREYSGGPRRTAPELFAAMATFERARAERAR